VDNSVCTGLVEGVEHMLQKDTGDVTGDIKKVYTNNHVSSHIMCFSHCSSPV